jgi:hypothetical protein
VEPPLVLLRPDRSAFVLQGDVMDIAERATSDFIPPSKDDPKVSRMPIGLLSQQVLFPSSFIELMETWPWLVILYVLKIFLIMRC